MFLRVIINMGCSSFLPTDNLSRDKVAYIDNFFVLYCDTKSLHNVISFNNDLSNDIVAYL